MLKHYFKFAIRNFRSNKTIFAGSLATLCLGALCISLLFSHVYNELTMDEFHENVEDIHMVLMKTSPQTEWQSPYRFNALDYPEIEHSTGIIPFTEDELKFKYDDKTYTPLSIVVDSSFFKVFDFNLKIGNKNTILKDFQSVILTEAFSKKVFGDENPIGKEVVVKGRMGEDIHIVKGIVEVPSNSSMKFDFILPSNYDVVKYSRSLTHYFLAKKDFNKNAFNKKIDTINNGVPNVYPQLTESKTMAMPFKDIYFDSDLEKLKDRLLLKYGNKKHIDTLIIVMLVILLISVLNFTNLQIVNVNSIVKNIAISKVNGAFKRQIIYQRIIENIILILLSALLITLLYNLILPYFNAFTKVPLSPPTWQIFVMNASILFLITSIGLIYPMFAISRILITESLKGISDNHKLKGKKSIIVLQYALTFVLVISSIVVTNQLNLMLSKDLGFNSEHVMQVKLYYAPPFNRDMMNWSREEIDTYRKKAQEKPEYINTQLASFSGIKNIGQGNSPLNIFNIDWKTKAESAQYESLNTLTISTTCQEVFGFELLEGRFFDKDIDQERGHKMIINEAAKKYWGIKNIEHVKIDNRFWGENYEIVGVVKDFNYEHLSSTPKPLIILYWEDADADYFIQFYNNQNQESITQIQQLFNEINPNQTFTYSFLSDEIAALYDKEKRLSTIYIIFTIIALLISAIGLFTIALYDTQRRIKEIGVRKVNGATIKDILVMLNKDFIKWVFVAFVIACPIAYYAMSKWLENFAYKTNLSWWVFALAGVFTLIIALLTVSWQSYQAATQNPVDSLRDE
ncbi:ABC transporter permease [Confluentibacter citreus]|uniref:ABC transporter permease n=1 Tax=Confluentibacter citreus TaxID=2007307 RepID=UPI000C293073|nr:ABC transporter permease [Confluentibacter citreus]